MAGTQRGRNCKEKRGQPLSMLLHCPLPLSIVHGGRSGVLGGGGFGVAPWGLWGVTGTPKYMPQNDPLVALIILNTLMWGL